MFRAHVLIIRRSELHYTASDIITPIGGRLVHRCGHEQDQDGTSSVSKPVWHIPFPCVQCKTPDDGQRNCPKHVEFYSKYKFEKLLHLVGFFYKNLSRCTVTWISNFIVLHLMENVQFFGVMWYGVSYSAVLKLIAFSFDVPVPAPVSNIQCTNHFFRYRLTAKINVNETLN